MDPKGAWGKGDGAHTVARKGFADENPVIGEWLKNFKMSEDVLGTLEAEINKRGPGHEEEAVAAWLEEHPDMVDRMNPK